MFDKEYIKNELINQGYNDHNAGLVADELMRLSPELVPCLEAWLTYPRTKIENPVMETLMGSAMKVLENKALDYESNGYSIMELMKERHMTYPAALLTIDWLLKEPEKAIQSLNKGRK